MIFITLKLVKTKNPTSPNLDMLIGLSVFGLGTLQFRGSDISTSLSYLVNDW